MKSFPLALALILSPLASTAGCDDDALTVAPVADVGADSTSDAITDVAADTGLDVPVKASEYGVIVVGTLAETDIALAKAAHDPLAAGGEEAAKVLGDFGHDVLLGTTLLGTPENEFLAIDRWNDLTGMAGFYADPNFAAAFRALFSAPPKVTTYVHQPTWASWGDLTSGDSASEYFFVVAQGTLKDADPATAQAAHDAIAGGSQALAEAAGDKAHVVFTGLEDPTQFLAIDIWHDSTPIESFYGNPEFQAAFGSLFSGPASVKVYRSTDWHQW